VIDLKANVELMPTLRRFFPHADVRKFQADLVNQLYNELVGGVRLVLIEAPTGLGKRCDVTSTSRPPRQPRSGPR